LIHRPASCGTAASSIAVRVKSKLQKRKQQLFEIFEIRVLKSRNELKMARFKTKMKASHPFRILKNSQKIFTMKPTETDENKACS
jgi:hypothetical protein